MSRWDKRTDDGHHRQRRREDEKFNQTRSSLSQNKSLASSETPSPVYSGSRSRSRSPPSHFSSRPCPSQQTQQRRSAERQAEEERLRRQDALNSKRRIYNTAGQNGTGTGPGGEIISHCPLLSPPLSLSGHLLLNPNPLTRSCNLFCMVQVG